MFDRLFRKKEQPMVEMAGDDEPTFNSFFSTSISTRNLNPLKFAKKYAFQVQPELKKIEGISDEVFAMDSGFHGQAMDAVGGKQTFNVNRQAIPDSLLSWYTTQSFIGYQACAIISQQWLVNKACTAPAEDAVCNGWEISQNSGDELDLELIAMLRDTDEKFKITDNLIRFEKFNRVFGIRIALFVVESNDPDYYRKPFNIDGVKKGKYKGISQIDPYWTSPQLNAAAVAEPASPDFYEPTYWNISGKLYHKSHFSIIRYSEVPDVLKPSYIYGGLPLTQLIYERAYAAERTANEAPMLAMTKRTTTLNVDMEAVTANQESFEEKISLWTRYRDNFAVKILGIDETLQETDTSLGDLDTVIMTQYQLVSSVANVPATRMLGTSPKGFNATGEHELKVYHESLESIQKNDLSPMLKRHYQLVLKSKFNKKLKFDISWNPVDAPTQKEQTEINMNKSTTYMNLQNSGAIDGLDIREALAADRDSGFNNIELPDEDTEEIEVTDSMDRADLPNVGYVSVSPRKNDQLRITDMVQWGAEIEGGVQDNDLHVTLFHDEENNLEADKIELNTQPLIAYPTGEFGILGEGESQALVMFLESDDLRARYSEIMEAGLESKHDEFIPHITLKYQPDETDLEKMLEYATSDGFKDRWNRVDFLVLDGERWKPVR